MDLQVGAALIEAASRRASGTDAQQLEGWAGALPREDNAGGKLSLALDDELSELMDRYPDRQFATTYGKEGIRCNAVCPGSVWLEEWTQHMSPGWLDLVTRTLYTHSYSDET